ncbi:MAG: endopeptidase La [Nitrospirae bacterium]|nr:endopeptidase La [Nitrospirota bacterium]
MVASNLNEKVFKNPQEEAEKGRQDIPDTMPIIPVKDTVLFPFTVIPLFITEEKSIKAVEQAMGAQRIIGVVTMKPNIEGDVGRDDLYSIGSAAVIHKMLRMPEKGMALIVQGLAKIAVKEFITEEPFLNASIEVIIEDSIKNTRIEALMRSAIAQTQKMISLAPYLPEELQVTAINLDDPVKLAYLIATIVRMPLNERQELLELESVEEKLNRIVSVLTREVELLVLGGKIQTQVQSEMSKAQREYYLREQLKAIKQELGETDERVQETNEIRDRLGEAKLPEEVMKEAERELGRLEKLPAASPEYNVIRTYLDWIMDLPWDKSTEDNLDLERAEKILNDDHYDLEKVKERIIEYLAVRKLKNDTKGPILCFVGPPGVGKTSLGQSIARALGRQFIRMSVGGMRDEAEIRGHRRTYIGALPGRIIQSIRRAGSNNPLFMIDEIDKVGSDYRGDPSSALLEVLDPEQNYSFRDHYMDLPFDLSKVMFITTANVLQTIHPALKDRMEVLNLVGYTEEEKLGIALNYLVPRQLTEHGLTNDNIEFDKGALRKIISGYTREAGVRNLEREIAAVCRKVAKKVAEGKITKVTVRVDDIHDFLGAEKTYPEVAKRTSVPGVATGLAWTETGGDILFIESTRMPGNKGFTLTGQLGDVMQESAKAALSYVRSKAKELGIAENFFDTDDIHLHVPAGAIPKDGPSAGVTMVSSLVSLLTGRPVSNDVAMTGEITLTGLVLPIGGIKEKMLAARRAGIKTVILPKRNEADLEDIPEELRKDLKFVFVETVDEVLKAALK